jgi:orotate phosphoribosyltransferase
MLPAARQRLLELFRTRVIAFGNFTLASGEKSTYYLNSKKALFHSECAALLGEAFFELTQDLNITAVGGLEVGALPLATATVMHYHTQGRTLEGFFVRKQAKDHGSKERVEGVLPPLARVAIIDDVLTTGGYKPCAPSRRPERQWLRWCALSIGWREPGSCSSRSINSVRSSPSATSVSNRRSGRDEGDIPQWPSNPTSPPNCCA